MRGKLSEVHRFEPSLLIPVPEPLNNFLIKYKLKWWCFGFVMRFNHYQLLRIRNLSLVEDESLPGVDQDI